MTVTPLDQPRARGRRVHHDERSRSFAVAPAVPSTRPWRHTMGPVLDQGQVNGCTGWSGVDWLNAAKSIPARERYNAIHRPTSPLLGYLTNDDGLFLYEQATQNDNLGWTYPPTDDGSTGLGVVKTLQKMGVIPEYRWTFDFQTMLAYAQHQPLLLGTVWTDAMMEPDAEGVLNTGGPTALRAADNAGEGHEFCLTGGNFSTGLAMLRNHWTASWGVAGDAFIRFSDLLTLLTDYRGDVAVPEIA